MQMHWQYNYINILYRVKRSGFTPLIYNDSTGHLAFLLIPALIYLGEGLTLATGAYAYKKIDEEFDSRVKQQPKVEQKPTVPTQPNVNTGPNVSQQIFPKIIPQEVFDKLPSDVQLNLTNQGYQVVDGKLAKYPWNELPTSGSRPFNPPIDKAGNPLVKKGPNGGILDANGNEWTWDKGAANVGNPHWDVQHPNGTHTNVNPQSKQPGEINHGPDNFKK